MSASVRFIAASGEIVKLFKTRFDGTLWIRVGKNRVFRGSVGERNLHLRWFSLIFLL